MARKGKFGRSTTGSANLSSFMNSLIQQSMNMRERALLNAFNDQTTYAGGVPNSSDIQDYVDSRTDGMDPNSAEYAYYQNMLENAKRQERARQAQSATTAFNATMGDNFDDFIDQISSLLSGDISETERQEFQALLAQKTAEYVDIVAGQYENGSVTYDELLQKTDKAIGMLTGTPQENAIVLRADSIMKREAESMDTGMLSGTDYRLRVQAAFRGIDPASPTWFDLNNKLFTTIWNREIDNQYGKVMAAKDKPTGTQIKKTQAYLEWARSQLNGLRDSGISGGELFDAIRNNIREYANTLSALKIQAGHELYQARLSNTESSKKVLDTFAAQAAIYVSGAAADNLREMTGGVTLNNVLTADPFAMVRYFDMNPEAQAEFDAALSEYRQNANGLVATARAIGADMTESKSYRSDATETARYTLQDTTLEDYEDAFEKKQRLIGEAQGDDSAIGMINNEWRKFLKGESTGTFGKGVAPTSSSTFAGLISNELAIYEYGVSGVKIDGIGSTLLDYIIPSMGGEDDPRSNGQIESELAAKTSQNAQLLLEGKAVRYIDSAGRGSTIGLRQADQGVGEYIFAEPNKYGKVLPTIRQGVRVVGTNRGSEVEGATWGFYYPDNGVWIESRTGKKFTSPPIQMRNGGAPEYDENGNPVRVTFDVNPLQLADDGISLKPGVDATSSAIYKSTNKVEVSEAIAIMGRDAWRTGGAGSVIGKATLDAITYSLDEKQKAEVEAEVAISNERIGRFDVGYGESRLTPEGTVKEQFDPLSTFDKFIGPESYANGLPKTANLITKAANGKSYHTQVKFSDAYTQTAPGVFVRKESATAVDALWSKPLDESKQFFPKIIDVSAMSSIPRIKTYINTSLPQASGSDSSNGIQTYFFRNSSLPSFNNQDVTTSRGAGAIGSSPIQTYSNLMSAQPIIDFRASERASLGTLGAGVPGSLLGSPISLNMPSAAGLANPLIRGVSGDSSRERTSFITGIQTPTVRIPGAPAATPGRIGGK